MFAILISQSRSLTGRSDVAVLLLVFNAAALCPTMLALFPDHTIGHYIYIKDTFPDMLPQLQVYSQLYVCCLQYCMYLVISPIICDFDALPICTPFISARSEILEGLGMFLMIKLRLP